MPVKQVIVVRADLKLRRGKEATQVAHASGMWMLEWIKSWHEAKNTMPTIAEMAWLFGNYRKIVVKATSEAELLRVQEIAQRKGLTAHLVVDDGLTEVPPGTVTALAIGPHEDSAFVGVTDHLPLY